MMKLSINSVAHGLCPGREYYSLAESIRFFGKMGFEAVDVNLCSSIQKWHFLQREDWREAIWEAKQAAEMCGVELCQSHLPFYNFAAPGCEELELREAMTMRSLEASAMLGVKWTVFHAGNAPDAVLNIRESKRRTLEYLKPLWERAGELGVGIAIENLFVPSYLHKSRRYCSNVEDVIDLVDTLGQNAGVCWDFGHANLVGDDQRDCLRAVGSRLKVIHVHDNNGVHDEHNVPYVNSGNVNWEEILPVLGKIGYRGNFNFEVAAARLPEDTREGFAAYVAAVGKHLMKLTECQ